MNEKNLQIIAIDDVSSKVYVLDSESFSEFKDEPAPADLLGVGSSVFNQIIFYSYDNRIRVIHKYSGLCLLNPHCSWCEKNHACTRCTPFSERNISNECRCNDGFFEKNGKCLKCDSSCLTCFNESSCLSCKEG